jgi:hypothetical protein
MDNERLVKKWQSEIVKDCEAILGRRLNQPELAFLSRGGFIALEMIHDRVKSLAGEPAKLQAYLQSETS